mmetsp:Transcript_19700/g.29835  ORF Transcript_19700/g.29835 Transcript_19700/m.29835 type:complete len:100 (+) Transcript_19700:1069-1368(+)
MNLRLGNIRILQTILTRSNSSIHKVLHHFLKLSTRNLGIHMLRPSGIRSNKRQRHIRLGQTIQFPLGLLCCLTKTLHGKIIPTQIHTTLLLEISQQMRQ